MSCGPSLLRGLGQRVGVIYVGVIYVGNRLVKFIGVTTARTSLSERISVLLTANQEPILVNAIDQTLPLREPPGDP
jgi:hypothetical protein